MNGSVPRFATVPDHPQVMIGLRFTVERFDKPHLMKHFRCLIRDIEIESVLARGLGLTLPALIHLELDELQPA
jgi:hypothetical protein